MQSKEYSEMVLDHYFQPRNVGELESADPEVIIVESGSAAGGELLKLSVRIKNNVIIAAKFKAHGGCATIAVGSWLTEKINQKTLPDISGITAQEIISALELPVVKRQAALLAQDLLGQLVGKNIRG